MMDFPRQHYIIVGTNGLPPFQGRTIPPQGHREAIEEESQVKYYVTTDGLPPKVARIPGAFKKAESKKSEAKKEDKPRQHYVVPKGLPPNGGRIPFVVAKQAKEDMSRQHYITRKGYPPNGGRIPAPAPKEAKKDPSRQHYITLEGVPPNGAWVPGKKNVPSAARPPSQYFHPAAVVPPPVYTPAAAPPPYSAAPAAGMPWYGLPIYTIPMTSAAPAAAVNFGPAPPNTKLGDSKISNLTDGAQGIFHPADGYCTFALLPRGWCSNGSQLFAPGKLPVINYLGHPGSSIDDLLQGLYGDDEETAKNAGVVEMVKCENGIFLPARRFRLGEEASKKRFRDVEWTAERRGENPVYLAWGNPGT